MTRKSSRIASVENLRDEALIFLSVVFLIAYALPIAIADLSPANRQICEWVQLGTWVLFGLDFLWRLATCPTGRLEFLRQNWIDLLILAVPAFRVLRLLRAASAAAFVARSMPATASFRLEISMKLAGASFLVWLLAGLAITEAELASTGPIQDLGQGLWWALTTMATVGYGDLYPITLQGRLIGGALMLSGIVIFSIITGTMASWIMERMRDAEESLEEQSRDLEQIKTELQSLKSAILSSEADDRG